MCGKGNHQGFIADTSFTRRHFLQAASALTAASGIAFPAAAAAAADADAAKVTEKNVIVRTADGNADAALFTPKAKGKFPAVLLWPDIIGLRPVFREMGRRLAAQGYVVLVPNPYYRARKAPVVEGSFNFGNPADRAKLMPLREGLSDAMVDRDSAAFIDYLDAQPKTDKQRKAGVQGYCMSGPFAFRTAAVRPLRIGAVAAFHPGALVTDEPSSAHLLIPKTRAAYLVILGANDAQGRPNEKPTLETAFAADARPARVEISSANHGWTVAGSQSYDESEAEKAWAELLAFYRTYLKGQSGPGPERG